MAVVAATRRTDHQDQRASHGRSAEIIFLAHHSKRHADAHDDAIGCECAIPSTALDHIGQDMTPQARADWIRRQRAEHRRRIFARIEQRSTGMGWAERIGHELVVRLGAVAIVGVLVALSKGWI